MKPNFIHTKPNGSETTFHCKLHSHNYIHRYCDTYDLEIQFHRKELLQNDSWSKQVRYTITLSDGSNYVIYTQYFKN